MLTCAMLLTLLPATALAAEPWDGSADTSWYGDGSNSEFTIDSAADLAGLAQLVNEGPEGGSPITFSGKTIKLAADIDLDSKEWTPIGNNTNKFQGIFDGAKSDGSGNYTISNLKITGNNSYVGLFGYTYGATVKKVTIKNADISGAEYVGTLIGASSFGNSTVQNVTIQGDISVSGTSLLVD